MKKILVFIGSLVLTLLIMSVPILCALSFALNWVIEVKFLLTVLTIVFGSILCELIYLEADN